MHAIIKIEQLRQQFLSFWRAFRPTVPRRTFAVREPKPWYRKSTDAWYAQVHQKQIRLATGRANRAEAKRKLTELLNKPTEKLESSFSAAQICDKYLTHSQNEHTTPTFEWHKFYLQKFCDLHGSRPALSLIPHDLNSWIAAQKNWKGSKRHARAIVKRAFEWARKEGLLTKNPFADVVVGKSGRRERILSKEEREEIMRSVHDARFKEFLTALQETGCRPSEISKVTAADVDLELGIWVLKSHKTAKKTGRDRVIYLTPTMVEFSKTLISRHPDGPLFRGRGGIPLSKEIIRNRFRRLRLKLPHLGSFSAYTYRHSYCTDALVNGVGIAHVAELMGHTSTEMVSRVYSKLSQQVQHMREAAKRATSDSKGVG
jgi:integrase